MSRIDPSDITDGKPVAVPNEIFYQTSQRSTRALRSQPGSKSRDRAPPPQVLGRIRQMETHMPTAAIEVT